MYHLTDHSASQHGDFCKVACLNPSAAKLLPWKNVNWSNLIGKHLNWIIAEPLEAE